MEADLRNRNLTKGLWSFPPQHSSWPDLLGPAGINQFATLGSKSVIKGRRPGSQEEMLKQFWDPRSQGGGREGFPGRLSTCKGKGQVQSPAWSRTRGGSRREGEKSDSISDKGSLYSESTCCVILMVLTITATQLSFIECSVRAKCLDILCSSEQPYIWGKNSAFPFYRGANWSCEPLSNWPKVLWQVKSQRPDSNPDVFHKLSTIGPQPPAGEGMREPQKVLNRKQKSWEPFWDNFLVASQEAWFPPRRPHSGCSQGINGRAPCLSLPVEGTPAQNPSSVRQGTALSKASSHPP